MVNGAGHHPVYAHSGQCSSQKQSALRSRAFHLSSRKQQLPLSRRPATQLRRTQHPEPYPCLHRDPQTLWWVRTKSAMHQLTIEVSWHPHTRAGPATRSRLSQHSCLCGRAEKEKKGGGVICGTQESDCTPSLALAEIKVCASSNSFWLRLRRTSNGWFASSAKD